MHNNNQFGDTLFIKDFQGNVPASRLERLHFLRRPEEKSPYDEKWLQVLIMANPSLLPVHEIELGFGDFVPVCMELPVGSGFVDNLLVTPRGDIALVECKLWRNPEARREVVGQIIDYATTMSRWSYKELQDAVARTKPFNGTDPRTQGLHELVSAKAGIDEVSFHDAVSRNLRRGRLLLLIVGDGIREGVEAMTEFLQRHAGLQFMLAMVEIALFKLPPPADGYIAQPRILAKTKNIERAIVRLDDGQLVIESPAIGMTTVGSIGKRITISQERYFEQLERNFPHMTTKVNAFIEKLANISVAPEFGTDSMILRWHQEDADWNLGTITTSGQLWMDYLGQQANNAGLLDLHTQFVRTLASLVPGAIVKETAKKTAWNVAKDGRSLTVDYLLADEAHMNGWIHAIAAFQQGVNKLAQSI